MITGNSEDLRSVGFWVWRNAASREQNANAVQLHLMGIFVDNGHEKALVLAD